MNITIKIIPREAHRPEVDGCDWYYDEAGDLQIRISPMSCEAYEHALILHELFEALACRHDGVTQKQVDDFDLAYDKAHPNEPDLGAGDDPEAPYHKQHNLATVVDRLFISSCGLKWADYDSELASIWPGPSKR